jgi:hypothetical protein
MVPGSGNARGTRLFPARGLCRKQQRAGRPGSNRPALCDDLQAGLRSGVATRPEGSGVNPHYSHPVGHVTRSPVRWGNDQENLGYALIRQAGYPFADLFWEDRRRRFSRSFPVTPDLRECHGSARSRHALGMIKRYGTALQPPGSLISDRPTYPRRLRASGPSARREPAIGRTIFGGADRRPDDDRCVPARCPAPGRVVTGSRVRVSARASR